MNMNTFLVVCVLSVVSTLSAFASDGIEADAFRKNVQVPEDRDDEGESVILTETPHNSSCLSRVTSYLPSLKTSLVVTTAFAYTGYNYYTAPQNGIVSAVSTVAGNLYSLAGGAFLGAQLFAEPLRKNGYIQWVRYAPNALFSGTTRELQDIVCRAEAKKAFWSENIRRSYELAHAAYFESGDQSWVRKLDYFSRLPTGIKKFDAQEVLTMASRELATYNEETRISILTFLNNVCTISNSELPLKRRSIFFLGDAGTGKTKMGKLIARALGVHMHLMSLGGFKAMDLLDETKPGHILPAFTPKISKNNFWNNVILVDEVDKALCPPKDSAGIAAWNYEEAKEYLLKLQDEDTLTHESRYLHYNGVELDFSSAILIFAGNKIPKDESFLTRAPTVRFAALAPELKYVIALASLTSYLSKLRPKEGVQDLIDQDVVKVIVEADKKFPGVRAMKKVIENYAFHVVNALAAAQFGIHQKFDIEAQYKQFLTLDDLKEQEEQDAEDGQEDEELYVVYRDASDQDPL